jgi:hypothetical protein
MELRGIGSSIFPLKDSGIQVGQRLLVEVLSRDLSGKAQICIAGQEISAFLEVPVEEGGKFWAKVKSFNDEGILLVHERIEQKLGIPPSIRFRKMETLPLHQLLNQNRNTGGKDLLASYISDNVPEWVHIGKEEANLLLFQFLRRLGLDYERRIMNIGKLSEEVQAKEKNELSKTLKGILLSLLERGVEEDKKSTLSNLLDSLTGHQFWLQNNLMENPFYLFEFPLRYNGELLTQRLAVKAARKGNKIDLGHCRIALLAQTPNLGEIGIEGRLFEGRLTLKVLGENPELLSGLVELDSAEVQKQFGKLGITLLSIGIAPLNPADDFHNFMHGEQREGVDIHI